MAAGMSGVSAAEAATPLPPAPQRPEPAAGPTKVGYLIGISDITRIESIAQTFKANCAVFLRWHDPRLKHAGPGTKRYALEDIWNPGLMVLNEASELAHSLPDIVSVTPEGDVVYRQWLTGDFTQRLDLRAFPFDEALFRIHFIAPGYTPSELVFEPDVYAAAAGFSDGFGMAAGLTVQDWRLLRTGAGPEPYTIAAGREIAGVAAEFTAARNSRHFVIKVILPLILIVMMSWAVFWIEPTDGGSQFGIAVTAMLTLFAYRSAVDSDVPKLPYLTCLDSFILMSSLLVFFSFCEVLVSTKLAGIGRLDAARRLDCWSRWIFPLVFTLTSLAIFLR